ncbi:MAG: phosphoribosylaminoimidazolesuccinocarboxamide synthase [Methanocalculus sp. MSAO_Arc1]|uniref:phosphoribosylaminoimidazolesuccinocarboxamide synthase n=1 Tax=Methanocalculus TaxID=71151 RepID=UPI000FEE1714|nr:MULTISPECIES: phosphoribosylaminoimidazolesuccinocarboxamide synthase [unclassified Methanocalculus]MCP1662946.1 phosphoribosylaminoimidazole-succinocarboxamide synthase [Methanocalculus sp. AMF5]RQD81470.1 MAG: phosphoribosylaminoimidazolesuccinocarboxamide synthase [Methanocalculus sp. MSAO_Arc1]
MNQGDVLISGKAKTVFLSEKPDELIVSFRDDITAFDGGKKDELQGKGASNAEVSAFLFRLLEEAGIPTHFIRMDDPTTMRVKKLSMIPLEVIVRNRAAGSLVRTFPFTEGQVFEKPIVVTDYKDDSRNDPAIQDDIIIALGLLTADELQHVKELAVRVNDVLKSFFESIGLDLVDFKLEFGKGNGAILLGDEISMDSMRLWEKGTMKSMDKDVYRFEKGDVMEAYRAVSARITGSRKE